MKLHVDLETFSSVDLLKYGMHKYVDSPDFEILLCAWAIDDEPVLLQDLTVTGGGMPLLRKLLGDEKYIKTSHNAAFEICCLEKHFGIKLDISQWRCTAVKAASLALPRSLAQVGEVLKMGIQKDKKGSALIRYFCTPCKPTKANGGRTRNLPIHNPEGWEDFKRYCMQDVETERELDKKLDKIPMLDSEWKLWQLDQEINNRGALIDMNLVNSAIKIDDEYRGRLIEEAMMLTGKDNPNSRDQMLDWLVEETGDDSIDTLTKADVVRLLKEPNPYSVDRVLKIRQELAKTSVTKYKALRGATCSDSRLRGTLLFYGAARTGRWAGRVFQPQNLPQNRMPNLALARTMVMRGKLEEVEVLYDSVSSVLSELIRTAIVPPPGKKFIVCDYSAIEARVLAWLAGEEWRLEVFRTHGKIYEASAAAAFNVPIESIGKHSPLRQQGKVLELACGYGGGEGAVEAMDIKKAIPKENRKALVMAWREASPKIKKFWWDLDRAVREAIENPGAMIKLPQGKSMYTKVEKGFLFIGLPSGRKLAYPRPRIIAKAKPWDQNATCIQYEGTDQIHKQWSYLDSYGPKFVENATQSVARDLLAYGLQQVELPIVLHVHDEAVMEAPMDYKVSDVEAQMSRVPDWAYGLPHRADGYETMFYKKEED